MTLQRKAISLTVLALSACVNELYVGNVPTTEQDSGIDVEDEPDARVEPRDSGAAKDAGVDASSPNGCTGRSCDASADATVRDARAAEPDAKSPEADAADAASTPRDAALNDAAKSDAAVVCFPIDCMTAGLRGFDELCADGSRPQCLPNERGLCELECPNDPPAWTGPDQRTGDARVPAAGDAGSSDANTLDAR